ncbi:carbohydrate kinase family protein [Solemya pervernicosa gill symbiont]|uniref:Carbohydrate kinase family protein n=2 Tax=Gammaproteobacteria incertae sedis TaxID=118884 RepID=A0A1T2L398_9GAMM|nr:carbohydrate kinase family protein [Candidatus Reidiella endopervernicosa]OOZ39480.1 carbohydrate kinase family protein [Solemya pervernicosa gill symbiont]QKQ25895.1 carbohydrate kinase family protein [Candidatus Reidiella endopervernicosa]
MSALICGSIAFDTIMVFHDQFKNHILPDKVHMLNISFLVPDMRREYGGCAGNIAYNLKLLGGDPLPMATVGRDFDPYGEWLEDCGIDTTHMRVLENTYTAQAFITTDQDDNQITAFHPGAMSFAHENSVADTEGVTIGIVAPDGRDGMIEHAQQFVEAGVPFIFDPGQGLPMFDGEDLLKFVDQATWVTVNDYEAQLLEDRTGKSPHEIAERVEALIITRGGEGSHIYTAEKRLEIPAATASAISDPTGCGDAYRAGLLYGLMNDLDWETTGRIASLMGAIKISHHGTQNHRFTIDEFKALYAKEFSSSF